MKTRFVKLATIQPAEVIGNIGNIAIVRHATSRTLRWYRVLPTHGENDHDCRLVHQVRRKGSGSTLWHDRDVLKQEGAQALIPPESVEESSLKKQIRLSLGIT